MLGYKKKGKKSVLIGIACSASGEARRNGESSAAHRHLCIPGGGRGVEGLAGGGRDSPAQSGRSP